MKLNVSNAADYLSGIIKELPHGLSHACLRVLNDEQFRLWPASIEKHHSHVGGLCLHTAEVVQTAVATALDKFNTHVLIVAGLYHDYGKLKDYEIADQGKYDKALNTFRLDGTLWIEHAAMIWRKSRARTLARHPVLSYHYWLTESTKQGIDEQLSLQISHAILAHHGRVEWGASVEPMTAEAQIIHNSDMLSAFYIAEDANRSGK